MSDLHRKAFRYLYAALLTERLPIIKSLGVATHILLLLLASLEIVGPFAHLILEKLVGAAALRAEIAYYARFGLAVLLFLTAVIVTVHHWRRRQRLERYILVLNNMRTAVRQLNDSSSEPDELAEKLLTALASAISRGADEPATIHASVLVLEDNKTTFTVRWQDSNRQFSPDTQIAARESVAGTLVHSPNPIGTLLYVPNTRLLHGIVIRRECTITHGKFEDGTDKLANKKDEFKAADVIPVAFQQQRPFELVRSLLCVRILLPKSSIGADHPVAVLCLSSRSARKLWSWNPDKSMWDDIEFNAITFAADAIAAFVGFRAMGVLRSAGGYLSSLPAAVHEIVGTWRYEVRFLDTSFSHSGDCTIRTENGRILISGHRRWTGIKGAKNPVPAVAPWESDWCCACQDGFLRFRYKIQVTNSKGKSWFKGTETRTASITGLCEVRLDPEKMVGTYHTLLPVDKTTTLESGSIEFSRFDGGWLAPPGGVKSR